MKHGSVLDAAQVGGLVEIAVSTQGGSGFPMKKVNPMKQGARSRFSARGQGRWADAVWGVLCVALLAGTWMASGFRAPESATTLSASFVPGLLETENQPAGAKAAEQPAEEAFRGWYAVYSGSGKVEVKSHAASPSFALPAGATIDPQVAPAGFVAEYTTEIAIEEAGKYRFGAEAEGGSATVTVFDAKGGAKLASVNVDGSGKVGKANTPYVALPKGDVQVVVKYSRKGDAAARLRTVWDREKVRDQGFRSEAIPITATKVPKFAKVAAQAGVDALHGRALLGELGCTSCHAGADGKSSSSAVAVRQAPLLGEIGRRARPEWLLKWILNPQAVKPGSHMPDVLGESPKDKADAEAIVQYLVAPHLSSASTEPAAKEQDVIDQGRYYFHTVGCVACHGPLESPAAAFVNEQGLSKKLPEYKGFAAYGDLAGKWRPAALSEFLQDPSRVHPGGRMPNMNLSTAEADLIATYLVNKFGEAKEPASFKAEPSKVETGKAAFAARGCADCHQIGHNLPSVASTLKAKALPGLTAGKGCLDPKSTTAPRYTLSDAERAALAAAVIPASKAQGALAPIDASHRQIEGLSCLACHVKDDEGGPAKQINAYFRTLNETELGDEGRLPPNLTGVGFKLTTTWLKTVLTQHGRARPYMGVRMPQFGEAHVGPLVTSLAAESGIWPNADRTEPKPSDEIAAAGRKLVGDSGLNCISCHVFGDYPSAGTPGPNITAFSERLRYDWWQGYIMNPHRFKAGTRMPNFYQTGTGAVKDVFGGDPDKQADAMWAYFNQGDFAPVPTGINTGKGLTLSVGDRPMVLRTFMKDAGSRGIAVGFPAGLHFAFDAGDVRLVDAWRGGFLDASGAWAGRGGNVSDEKGITEWKAPAGPALILEVGAGGLGWPKVTSAKALGRFKGYTLDKGGVPTFMYSIGAAGPTESSKNVSANIRERFEPAAEAGVLFRRSFGVEMAANTTGVKLFVNAGKGKVLIADQQNCKAIERAGDDGSTWFEVELSAIDGKSSFVVVYSKP